MTLHFCAVFVTVSFYGHPFPNTYFELILMAFLTKVFRFQRNILLFSFSFFFCILLISYKHCLRDFSITTWPIYIKLLDPRHLILPLSSWRSVLLFFEFVFYLMDFWDGSRFVIVIFHLSFTYVEVKYTGFYLTIPI